LADKYGFPLMPPVDLGVFAPPATGSSLRPAPSSFAIGPSSQILASQPSPAQTPILVQDEKTNPFKGDADAVRVGRSVFNQHCAHCHSPNAMNPEPRTDLRRLKRRYGENMANVALQTITEGRVANGMPPWKEMLSEEAIWKILTFLESVQSPP
jgi:polar amino acid transport system substrate-binding protein